MSEQTMGVGEISRRSGIAISALHFYETQGLITSTRTAGNQRRYRRDTLRRLAVIQVAQRVGLPLRTIAEALETLPANRTPTRADWTRLSAYWRDELDTRIAELVRLRDTLTDCIGCGCLSIRRCKLRNPGDALSTQGSGPRRLLESS